MTYNPNAVPAYTFPVADGSNGQVMTTNGSGVVTFQNVGGGSLNIASANDASTDSPGSDNAYVDLGGGAGPSVTLTTGTSVIVWIAAMCDRSGTSNSAWLSFAVSGATTLAASDANSMDMSAVTSGLQGNLARVCYVTGLTAGSNTFTLKYKVDGAHASWSYFNRSIAVLGL